MSIQIQAQVLNQFSDLFHAETLRLREVGPDEILVRIAGTGICHTDIKVSNGYAQVPLPVVLGHEGAGIVEQAGSDVDHLVIGDHVVLTFPSCGQCAACTNEHPAYCFTGHSLSFSCEDRAGSSSLTGVNGKIHGNFFGQSSFASHVVASGSNAVKVERNLPIEKLGPLGCGFQTGAGAVLNVMQPAPGNSLAVFGSGNVGLSAIMAARIAEMDPIIAIDNREERLVLARELGATHAINLAAEDDPGAGIRKISMGAGVSFSLDTTNNPTLVRQAFESLGNQGTCIHSGGGGKDLCFPGSHLLQGRTVKGVIQGDSNPGIFIPQLLEYFKAGQFPFDRLLTLYPLTEINKAVLDMKEGRVVKPVLRP